jgi:hypothetical protein
VPSNPLMSEIREEDPMIEFAQPAGVAYLGQDELLEDPSTFFRGLLVAVSLSLPLWGGLFWGLTKIA